MYVLLLHPPRRKASADRADESVAGINTTKARKIYTVTFDNDNFLQSIDLTDKESGMVIAHIDEKTPTPGETFGVLEQIFSNLRRGQTEQ